MAATLNEVHELSDSADPYDDLTRDQISQLNFPPTGICNFSVLKRYICVSVIGDPLLAPFLPPENVCNTCIGILREKGENDWIVKYNWGYYDITGLYRCRKLHSWKLIKSQLENEKQWCQYVTNQNWCTTEMKNEIDHFLKCISEGVHNRSLGEAFLGMTPEVLRCFASSYWYGESQLDALGTIINSIVLSGSNHLYVFPIGNQAKPPSCRYFVLFMNVKYFTATGIATATDDGTGNHWALCVYDNVTMHLFYGDSLLWPFPYNIKEFVSAKIGKEINSISSMHKWDAPNVRRHVCVAECHGYPLQIYSVSCGPIAAFVCIILACSEEIAEKFLSRDDLMKKQIMSAFARNNDMLRVPEIGMVMSKKLPSLNICNETANSEHRPLVRQRLSTNKRKVRGTSNRNTCTEDKNTVSWDEVKIETDVQWDSSFLLCGKATDGSQKENYLEKAVKCERNTSNKSTVPHLNHHNYVKTLSEDSPKQPERPSTKTENCNIYDILPEGYEYTIDSQNWFSPDDYLGAPSTSFSARIWANIKTSDQFEEWLKMLQEKTKTVYRITATYKPSKKVLYRTTRHCQHRSRNYNTKAPPKKKKKKTLLENNRSKAADCKSVIKGTIYFNAVHPSKPCYLQVNFQHSHPIISAHVLSFRDLSVETRSKFQNYFKTGHSVGSAKLTHETELQLSTDQIKLQEILADRSLNPSIRDLHRLRRKWLEEEVGPLQGSAMFDEMERIVDDYNKNSGGNMKMQRFNSRQTFIPDHHYAAIQQKAKSFDQPLLLTICTPVMKRAHEMLPQCSEVIFCDATSSLDVLGCTTFILSTASPAGAIPIGVLITSGESIPVLTAGFHLLTSTLPTGSFHGRENHGPLMFMTDDAESEKQALKTVWPESKQLLCIFHVLQAVWRWILDSKHGITEKFERQIIMQLVKAVLYAKTTEEVTVCHDAVLANQVVQKHDRFQKYYLELYDRKIEWATAYRQGLKTRGSNTNNYAESSIRILKEIVFQRTKAYNIIQLATFINETLERYLQRRLLSLAHNRLDHHIANKFLGVGVDSVPEDSIKSTGDCTFQVKSARMKNVFYEVDLLSGVCSCLHGSNGTFCKHQAAVVKKTDTIYLNAVPISAVGRQMYAKLALGQDATKGADFFVGLNEKICINEQHISKNKSTEVIHHPTLQDDLSENVDAEHHSDEDFQEPNNTSSLSRIKKCIDNLEMVSSDLNMRLHTGEPSLLSGIEHFCQVYSAVTTTNPVYANNQLSTFFHNFGKASSNSNVKHRKRAKVTAGAVFSGKRIPVNSTGCMRRRPGLTRGKSTVKAGRPCGTNVQSAKPDSAIIPGRKGVPKVSHNLALNIQECRLNPK